MKRRRANRTGKENSLVVPSVSKLRNATRFRGGIVCRRFSHAGKDGPFRWEFKNPADLEEVMNKLSNLETMYEKDIDQNNHFIKIQALSPEAKQRLRKTEFDDVDKIHSIRISGSRRVFCVHEEGCFPILWYDPDHKVCPSNPKNT